MTRYIVRYEKSESKPFTFTCDKLRSDLALLLMKELYDYREEIDYNSWIYVIDSIYQLQVIHKARDTSDNEYVIRYVLPEELRSHPYFITNMQQSDISHEHEYVNKISLPKCLLLFNKNNQCKVIHVSDKLLYNIAHTNGGINYYFNIGLYTYIIDASYDFINKTIKINNNTVKVPDELIPFISKNTPSLQYCVNYPIDFSVENGAPREIYEFVEGNIESIKKDLHISDHVVSHSHRTFTYITAKETERVEYAARKEQLLKQLKELEQLELELA